MEPRYDSVIIVDAQPDVIMINLTTALTQCMILTGHAPMVSRRQMFRFSRHALTRPHRHQSRLTDGLSVGAPPRTSTLRATAGGIDKAGRVTQGRVSTSRHSSCAKRLARSGGKSVSLVTEPVLASAKGDGIASSCLSLSPILDQII